jgi:hypothetical protein
LNVPAIMARLAFASGAAHRVGQLMEVLDDLEALEQRRVESSSPPAFAATFALAGSGTSTGTATDTDTASAPSLGVAIAGAAHTSSGIIAAASRTPTYGATVAVTSDDVEAANIDYIELRNVYARPPIAGPQIVR